VSGGESNVTSYQYSTIGRDLDDNAWQGANTVGERDAAGGPSSPAAGYRTNATHGGAFFWPGQPDYHFPATTENGANVRCTGAARSASVIDASCNTTNVVYIISGSGCWSSIRSWTTKEGCKPVAARQFPQR
jgi:hypothetical protein